MQTQPPAEGGQQREDEQPEAELQTAVTEYNMQPAVVQFWPDSSSSTAGTMPPAAKTVGNTASGGQPAPVKVASRHQIAAEVAEFSNRTAGTTTPTPAEQHVVSTSVIPTELVGDSISLRGKGFSRKSSAETGHEAESADTTLKVKV